MPPAIPEERIRVRDVLIDLVSDRLFVVVTECAKQIPLDKMAAYIEGDEHEARKIVAGSRRYVADKLRAYRSKREIAALADLLLAQPPDELLPCAFVVHLTEGMVDVSVVGLRMVPD